MYNQKPENTWEASKNDIQSTSKTVQPLRQITIIPIDSNSKMISLNSENADYVMNNTFTTTSIGQKKVIQN